MVLVKDITMRRRSDIVALNALIGYRANDRLKNVRAALAESPAVLRHLISNDEHVLKAVRRKLAELQDRRRICARVPQNDSLRKSINAILNGHSARFSSWSPAKLKQALRSRPVVEVTNRKLQDLCGSRTRHNKLRKTINQILKECSETRLGKAA
jgi:fatty acid-binding protein DegV